MTDKTEVIEEIFNVRKSELTGLSINGWIITSLLNESSGEADHYYVTKGNKKGVLKFYRSKKPEFWHEAIRKIMQLHACEIIKVNEEGVFNNRSYTISNFYEEGSVVNKKIDSNQINIFLKDMVNALSCIHLAQLIHCDIKLDNIFIENDHYVLADLGSIQEQKKNVKNFSYTTSYAPPEVILARKFDSSYDYYSLGLCLFSLVTGVKPFEARMKEHIFMDKAVGYTTVDIISRKEFQTVPYNLRKLITGLLNENVKERFTFKEINNYLNVQPIDCNEKKITYELPNCGVLISDYDSLLEAFCEWPEIVSELLIEESSSFISFIYSVVEPSLGGNKFNKIEDLIKSVKHESSMIYPDWTYDFSIGEEVLKKVQNFIEEKRQ